MKKVIYSTLSVALLTVGLVSCGKTTKGKMVNDWKITSYDNESNYIDDDGDKSSTKTTMTETIFTRVQTNTPNGGTTSSSTVAGTVKTHTLSVKKDGTWEMVQEYQTTPNTSTTVDYSTKTSGTWSFVGKTKGDEFKKNERVIFNVLTENNSTVSKTGSVSVSNTSSDTYSTGEYVMIFTVVESKGKELQLEQVFDNTYTYNTSTDKSTGTTKMTLVQ